MCQKLPHDFFFQFIRWFQVEKLFCFFPPPNTNESKITSTELTKLYETGTFLFFLPNTC
jgi:hypothetical protein